MSQLPPWTQRLPALRAEVERSTSPVWFNADLQKLLGLRRRQVTRLMKRWGAELHAHDFEVTKAAVLRGLQEVGLEKRFGRAGRPTGWILRLQGAIEVVEGLPAGTILIAGDLARLLHVSRARAADLALSWGARRVGRRLEVRRERLLEGLRGAVEPKVMEVEVARRLKLQEGLAAARLLVPLARGHRTTRRFERLPANVRVSPGRLELTGSPKEIVAGLVAVAEALQADPLGFEETQRGWSEALTPPSAPRSSPAPPRTATDLRNAARAAFATKEATAEGHGDPERRGTP